MQKGSDISLGILLSFTIFENYSMLSMPGANTGIRTLPLPTSTSLVFVFLNSAFNQTSPLPFPPSLAFFNHPLKKGKFEVNH